MADNSTIHFRLSAPIQELNKFVEALQDVTAIPNWPEAEQCKEVLGQLRKMVMAEDGENIWPLLLQVVLLIQKSYLEQQNMNENIVTELIREVMGIEDAMIQSVQNTNQAFNHNGQQYDSQLTAYMGGLAQEINNASSLQILKSKAVSHLSNMRESITSRHLKEKEIISHSKKEIERLSKELAVAQQTMKNLENERVMSQKVAMTCPLTGIANKRAFDKQLAYSINDNPSWPFCLAVLDVDHFKVFNDKYGHKAGDKVLITIAQQISQLLSEDDYFFRYAGDEFVAIFHKKTLEQSITVAEKIYSTIAAVRFRYKQDLLKITLTIGLTQVLNDDTETSLFERADMALLEAKRNRSQVVGKNG
jgi:diguanylate cyclase